MWFARVVEVHEASEEKIKDLSTIVFIGVGGDEAVLGFGGGGSDDVWVSCAVECRTSPTGDQSGCQ